MVRMPTIHRCRDAEQLALAAAEAVASAAAGAIAHRGRFVIALSGGHTPRRLYQSLAAPPFRERVDWSRAEFFWGDERTVPPDHEDSNFRMANELLLRPLEVPPERIHRIAAERRDVETAAQDYAMDIANCFGVAISDPPPPFDVVLLGMGDDGHTASLFPGTLALRETKRWVVANPVPQHSTTRITVTYPVLNRARAVFFLVSGAGKASVLADVLCGPKDPRRLPSQQVHPADGRLEWFVDEAAAAKLPATV